ncbi:MAG: phage FluMu protein Com [Mariniblastus sp.]|jgi:phage FluMu protein Com
MSIEFTCPHCNSLLRVEDANAGKRARCPNCSVINRIPGERVDTTPVPPVSQQFFIDSVAGQTYGPVTQQELDQWVEEGRVSADCLIRATGQRDGRSAASYFPQLGEESPVSSYPAQDFSGESQPANSGTDPLRASVGEETTDFQFPTAEKKKPVSRANDNPYSASYVASSSDSGLAPELERIGVRPVEADLGEVFSQSYATFSQHLPLLAGVGAVCGILQFTIQFVTEMTTKASGVGIFLGLVTLIVLNLIQAYLVIGQTRVSLSLIRGEPAEFSDLFNGGDKFLPIVGYTLLIAIPLLFGFLLLIIPGILLCLYFWSSYSLIVDNKTSVMDSFGIAGKIGERNLLNSFVIGAAGIGILILGGLLCFVGLFFASGFVSVLYATAYLIMSGQIPRLKR